MKSTAVLLLVCSVCASVAITSAAPITFYFSGSGAGSLDGVSFSETGFSITATADTDDWQEVYPTLDRLINHSASIVIDGVGSFTFVSETSTHYSSSDGSVGLGRGTGATLIDRLFAPELAAWDLVSSVETGVGALLLQQWTAIPGHPYLTPVLTDGGQLVFDTVWTTGVFKAAVTESVPETGATGLLLGVLLVGLFISRRRSG